MLPLQNKISFYFERQINYWNFGVYKKQKFVTLTSHIFGFCLFVINYSYFDKLSDLQKEFLINKSKKVTEFQRQLAVLEDENLLKEMKLANIKVEKIDEEKILQETFSKLMN